MSSSLYASISSNGNSTYRLNDAALPYAEYVKVLEGENILVKARNFLVFQGDVEAIATKSPKELTRLIEQICGSDQLIPEYEEAKEAMETSHELSSYAFTKKRGITAELKMIQDQMEELARFDKLGQKKDSLMKEWMLWRLLCVEEQTKQLAADLEERRQQTDKQSVAEIEKKEEELREVKKKLAKSQKDCLALEKRVKKTQNEIDSEAPVAMKVAESVHFGQKKLSGLQATRTNVQQELDRQQTRLKQSKIDLEELEEAFAVFQENSKKQLDSLDVSPVILEEYNELKAQASAQASKEAFKLESLERKQAPELAKKREVEDKKTELDIRKRRLEEQIGPMMKDQEGLSGSLENVKAELESKQRELQQARANKKKLEQNEAELTDRLKATLKKLMQAKADKNENEKMSRLKAAITGLRRYFPGVHGRIIDLCQPTHRKYELALSLVIGKNMDSIVVDSEKTAIEAIEWMKEQKAGQATFIPLDTIRVKSIEDRFRTVYPSVRPAIDIIQ